MFSFSEQSLSQKTVGPLYLFLQHLHLLSHVISFLGKLVFLINILAGTGEFEVHESDLIVVSGFIKIQTSDEQTQLPEIKSYETDQLSATDVYQDLACKGYKYSKRFQGINLASNNGIKLINYHKPLN